ncbi:P-loop containing nucleoside triphosphate hydrolase protein [Pisolithus croceorrhizus]|nr:P-loop containing nucleoside triphosphate hydrolase protein [Pisolithus croceorrhizus]KAI6158375.1 P-loop containing nucleoside triphosphate hydrolase protein [Pisolithus thermaeus]
MGPTGAGKSSFVAKATNSGDEGVGHGLISHTSDIKATRCIIGGSNVVLVDTPGFDDTKKSDLQILESISDWFNKSYKKGTSPSGILYFHRISDNRMAGTPLKNLRVFKKLCGNKVMPHVVLVTTMWDEVDESVGDERFQELKDNYWRPMILQGSTTYRYRNTLKSAEELLLQLVERKRREIASQKQSADKVRLQKQMADKNMELRETDAGRELYSRLDQIAEKRAEILARITAQRHQAGDQATADDLAKQYESLKAELDETLRQMQALKLTSAQRVAARIRKTFKVRFHFFFFVLPFISDQQ